MEEIQEIQETQEFPEIHQIGRFVKNKYIVMLTGKVNNVQEYKRYILNNFPEAKLVGIRTTDVSPTISFDEMFKYGFIPGYFLTYFPYLVPDNFHIQEYLNKNLGMDLHTRYFWDKGIWNSIDEYKDVIYQDFVDHNWFYGSLDFWKEFGTRTGNSRPLLIIDPNLVYSSNRPLTDMKIYQQSNHLTYFQTEELKEFKTVEYVPPLRNVRVFKLLPTGKVGIPVTRYSLNSEVGLFYTFTEDFCGTFYYYEPESTTFLSFNTIAIYPNKLVAFMDLSKKVGISEKDIQKERSNFYNYDLNLRTATKERKNFAQQFYENTSKTLSLFPDLKMSPLDVVKYGQLKRENYKITSNLPRYAGKHLGYMAKEDNFDQPICELSQQLGIELVVFTTMVGSHQLVTEVLDTRDRIVSYNSLVYEYKVYRDYRI